MSNTSKPPRGRPKLPAGEARSEVYRIKVRPAERVEIDQAGDAAAAREALLRWARRANR